jgi:hypothetical protein
MKSVIRISILVLAVLLSVQTVCGWNAQGHTVIGHIADRNLTPNACKMRDK